MIKHVCINELINKLFTFANFYQININNDDDNYNNYVNCIESERSAPLI